MKLRYFPDTDSVLAYVMQEIIATLQDDLDRMRGEERQHYSKEERAEMKSKIQDVQRVELLVLNAADLRASLKDISTMNMNRPSAALLLRARDLLKRTA